MSLFSKGGSLFCNTIRKDRVDRELSEEVSSYGGLLTEKKMNFVLRAAIDPAHLSAAATKEIHVLDPDQPVSDIRMLDQSSRNRSRARVSTPCSSLIGITASLALATLLFGITATDLPTFLAVSAVLAIVALIANYIPARRAARVNPVIALRYE